MEMQSKQNFSKFSVKLGFYYKQQQQQQQQQQKCRCSRDMMQLVKGISTGKKSKASDYRYARFFYQDETCNASHVKKYIWWQNCFNPTQCCDYKIKPGLSGIDPALQQIKFRSNPIRCSVKLSSDNIIRISAEKYL